MRRGALIVGALALLVAALVVRSALLESQLSRDPARAAAVWPGHPDAVLAAGLTQVGEAATAGRSVDPSLVRQLVGAAAKSPLAPEPFLVRGVDAQLAGNQALAGQAFVEARRREPRSVAARYFLADHYLRTGQVAAGLGEVSALTRLVPQSLNGVAPYLAAYARSPDGTRQVKSLIRRNPELEPVLLGALAGDARDARLALSLWSGRTDGPAERWQGRLLNSLVGAGRYAEAHDAWLRFTRAPVGKVQLIDSEFRSDGLPPFAWSLSSGPNGVAEPQGNGSLHVIYYGRENMELASHVLLLKPSRYRLAMRVNSASPAARSLTWTVRCLSSLTGLAEANAGSIGAGRALAMDFVVPSTGCTAQLVQLNGTAPELPEQAELTISQLRLEAR